MRAEGFVDNAKFQGAMTYMGLVHSRGKFLGSRNIFYDDVSWLYPRFKKLATGVALK